MTVVGARPAARALEEMLLRMWRIRCSKSRPVELLRRGLIRGPVHSYAGMEAIAVGVCSALRDDDLITSTHRGHGHCIAKGLDLGADDGRDHRARRRLLPRARRQHAHHRDRQGHARRGRDRGGSSAIAVGAAHGLRLQGETPCASASSATAPRTRASSTRRSTSPPCSTRRSCSSARTTSGRSRRRSSARSAVRRHRGPGGRLRLPRRGGRRQRRPRRARRSAARPSSARERATGRRLIEAKSYRIAPHSAATEDGTPVTGGARRAGGRATRSSASARYLVEAAGLPPSARRGARGAGARRGRRRGRGRRSTSPKPEPRSRARGRLRPGGLAHAGPAVVTHRDRRRRRELTIAEALNEALREEMERDPGVFVIGEDIAALGGLFQVTAGLLDRFGPARVIDAPISEAAHRRRRRRRRARRAAGRSSSCRSPTSSRS